MNVLLGTTFVALGLLYGVMAWAQVVRGRPFFVVGKDALQSSAVRQRQGMLGALLAVLTLSIGIAYLLPSGLGRNIASIVIFAAILFGIASFVYWRIRTQDSRRPK